MKRPQIAFAALALLIGTLTLRADHEKSTKSLFDAFKEGNASDMSNHFAQDVQFIGDHGFIGRADELTAPVSIGKRDLATSYARLFEARREQWAPLAKKLKPTITVSENGGELLGLVKKGDVICDMHFREASKGSRNGFDEAVIFVFRKAGDSYKVVIHLADY